MDRIVLIVQTVNDQGPLKALKLGGRTRQITLGETLVAKPFR